MTVYEYVYQIQTIKYMVGYKALEVNGFPDILF